MKLSYRRAGKEDAEPLIGICNAAFSDGFIRYEMCPRYGNTQGEMEASTERHCKYLILCDGIPVGAFSFDCEGEGHYYLGCLCVIPAYQGIGSQAFRYLLLICPDWKRVSLVTPADKEENLRFYRERCGFCLGDKKMDGTVVVVGLYRER